MFRHILSARVSRGKRSSEGSALSKEPANLDRQELYALLSISKDYAGPGRPCSFVGLLWLVQWFFPFVLHAGTPLPRAWRDSTRVISWDRSNSSWSIQRLLDRKADNATRAFSFHSEISAAVGRRNTPLTKKPAGWVGENRNVKRKALRVFYPARQFVHPKCDIHSRGEGKARTLTNRERANDDAGKRNERARALRVECVIA